MDGGVARADLDLVGVGLYTTQEAHRFTGVKAATIRRWVSGYNAHGKQHDALWSPQIHLDDTGCFVGFRDLTEIRVVAALLRTGLSLKLIRKTIKIARNEFGLERPLSTRQFRTDGERIYLILSEEREEVIDAIKNQFEMQRVIEPTFKELEFDAAGEPVLWRIAPGIVLDPHRAFGQPVEAESGIPAEILADALIAEGSIGSAARVYGVSERAVRRAADFVNQSASA